MQRLLMEYSSNAARVASVLVRVMITLNALNIGVHLPVMMIFQGRPSTSKTDVSIQAVADSCLIGRILLG